MQGTLQRSATIRPLLAAAPQHDSEADLSRVEILELAQRTSNL